MHSRLYNDDIIWLREQQTWSLYGFLDMYVLNWISMKQYDSSICDTNKSLVFHVV